MKFSIRDLIWLTLIAGCLTSAWLAKRENAALREVNTALRMENASKVVALENKSKALNSAADREKKLRKEIEIREQIARGLGAGLKKREAELQESLDKREAMINALRIIKETPAQPGS